MARDRIVPVKHHGSATAEPDYAGNIISTMLPMLLLVRFEPSSGKKKAKGVGVEGGGGRVSQLPTRNDFSPQERLSSTPLDNVFYSPAQ